MDNLSDISKAVSRFDEILVAETDEEDHLHTLSLVLERHLNAGFRLTRQSARLFSIISCVPPTQDKRKAIRNAPRPKDVTPLKSFLGLIMFCSPFMPYHSTVLAPLHQTT